MKCKFLHKVLTQSMHPEYLGVCTATSRPVVSSPAIWSKTLERVISVKIFARRALVAAATGVTAAVVVVTAVAVAATASRTVRAAAGPPSSPLAPRLSLLSPFSLLLIH